MAKEKITANVKLASYEDLFQSTQTMEDNAMGSKVMEIPLKELHEFKNHPFHVFDDEKMEETVESIRQNGVLVPAIARVRQEGGYELISGHRRHRACELAGLTAMPVIVRNLTDEEATVIMVDSNIQREELLISEKAKAYSMKFLAEKKLGKASGDLFSEMCEQSGESRKQIQRFIWISRLLPELLRFVDEGKLGFTQGVDLSFLNGEQQAWVLLVIKLGQISLSIRQSAAIKEMAQSGELTFEGLQEMLSRKPVFKRKIVLNEKELSKYFDQSYSTEDIQQLIIEFLESRRKGGQA